MYIFVHEEEDIFQSEDKLERNMGQDKLTVLYLIYFWPIFFWGGGLFKINDSCV